MISYCFYHGFHFFIIFSKYRNIIDVHKKIIIIIIIIIPCKFFPQALADILLLETEWQQDFSNLQDSPRHAGQF